MHNIHSTGLLLGCQRAAQTRGLSPGLSQPVMTYPSCLALEQLLGPLMGVTPTLDQLHGSSCPDIAARQVFRYAHDLLTKSISSVATIICMNLVDMHL